MKFAVENYRDIHGRTSTEIRFLLLGERPERCELVSMFAAAFGRLTAAELARVKGLLQADQKGSAA